MNDEDRIIELFNDIIIKPINEFSSRVIENLQALNKEVLDLEERVSKLEDEKGENCEQ